MFDIIKDKKIKKIILIFILSLSSFFIAHIAWAEPIDAAVTTVIGWTASLIILVCGWILTLAISSIITIVSYNNFIYEPAIVQAWVVVRDLCNMFFIVILLVIAFATILRVESYQWKKMLPKLIIMAVLINFSKTICGLLIDLSQVVLLTFTNAFSGGGGNFVNYLKVKELLAVAKSSSSFWGLGEATLNLTNTVAAMMFAIILMIVATVAMLAILIVFLMRMIMLWIYVVLSPLAFLLMAFPQGQKYASNWWSEFTKYLINGPVLAFFIWLALMVMAKAPTFTNSIFYDPKTGVLAGAGDAQLIKALQSETLLPFILAIGLLVGGLMISQQIGGIGASWGMNMVNNLKNKGIGIARKGIMAPLKGAKSLAGFGIDKLSEAAGIDFNVVRGYKRLREQMKQNKESRELNIYKKSLAKADEGRFGHRLALVSTGNLLWQNLRSFYKEGFAPTKRMVMGGKWAKKKMDDKEGRLKEITKERKTFITAQEQETALKNKEIYEGQRKVFTDRISDAKDKLSKLDPKDEKNDSKIATLMSNLENWEDKVQKIDIGVEAEQAKSSLPINNERAEAIKEEKKKLDDEISKFKLRDYKKLETQASAELESNQAKTISNIDNNQELGQILKDAIKEGNQGLIAAVSKKMARNSDYNEMQKVLGLGTGRDGMLKLADMLQKKAGFSQQGAYGLIGEIGNICKQIKHFAAFGAVTMEHGRWRESSRDEYNANISAEMSKLQIQDFARNTNRLGVGEYINGDHTVENWRPLESALRIMQENGTRLATQYFQTGQPNTMLHMAHYEGMSKAANLPTVLIEVFRNSAGGAETDWETAVKRIREKINQYYKDSGVDVQI